MAALASQINIESLEKYLEIPPEDFFYVRQCKAALEFAKAVQSPYETK
jgi:hypothetical protein